MRVLASLVPIGSPACDHIEETVPPAETLGKHYIVSSPTSALGKVVGHIVRIFGNVDGTTLSYPAGAPPNAPQTIAAGQVVDLGVATRGFGIARVKLGPGQAGAHVLESTHGVGLQVMGYGSYTSYQYPGGLNLETIAPPPPPVR